MISSKNWSDHLVIHKIISLYITDDNQSMQKEQSL